MRTRGQKPRNSYVDCDMPNLRGMEDISNDDFSDIYIQSNLYNPSTYFNSFKRILRIASKKELDWRTKDGYQKALKASFKIKLTRDFKSKMNQFFNSFNKDSAVTLRPIPEQTNENGLEIGVFALQEISKGTIILNGYLNGIAKSENSKISIECTHLAKSTRTPRFCFQSELGVDGPLYFVNSVNCEYDCNASFDFKDKDEDDSLYGINKRRIYYVKAVQNIKIGEEVKIWYGSDYTFD